MLTCEQVFAQIFRGARAFLFRASVIAVAAARFSGCPLRGKHRATFGAPKKIGEWKIVRAAHSTLAFPARKNFLDGFKLARRKNGGKASGKILVVMLGESEICAVRQYSFTEALPSGVPALVMMPRSARNCAKDTSVCEPAAYFLVDSCVTLAINKAVYERNFNHPGRGYRRGFSGTSVV